MAEVEPDGWVTVHACSLSLTAGPVIIGQSVSVLAASVRRRLEATVLDDKRRQRGPKPPRSSSKTNRSPS